MISPLYFMMLACSQPDQEVAPTINSENFARIMAVDSARSLKASATFPMGAAFHSAVITKNPKAMTIFLNQFNAKTVHAYMNIQPTPGQFNFREPDYWVKVAATNSLRLHGHCLVYHMAMPAWFGQFGNNTAAFEQAVKTHIQTVVGRYRGKIQSWDVINEIFDPNSGSIRKTAFRQYYKSDADYLEFVKRCFVWAHEADPNAQLLYNDYGYESSPAKLSAVLKLVQDFKRSGTPLHGIGTQMHISINTPDAGIINSLRQLNATGLPIHISELDIAVNPSKNANMAFTADVERAQRTKYQVVAAAYKRMVAPAQQFGITLWDFSDGDSWLATNSNAREMPTIFDVSFNKKAAYYGLLAGLQN